MATLFMGIDLPSVGVTIGPTWAQLLNDAIQDAIDPHDHTPGRGTLVPSAGININSDLAWNNKNLNTVREVRLQDQLGNLSVVADRGGIYRNADDLFYLDGAGNNVRITSGGSVAGAAGNITGLVAPAAATYSAITKTFTWTQDANFPAKMDSGDITFRETVLNGNGVTFKAPAGLSAGYSVTWPGALPAATHLMGMTAGGVVSVADDPTFNSRPTFEGVGLGNTADTTAGNVRFDGSFFEGRRNAEWRRLEGWEILAFEKLAAPGQFASIGSIPARDTYKLLVYTTGDSGANNLALRFNGDTGTNYCSKTLTNGSGSGGAWSQTDSTNAAQMVLGTSAQTTEGALWEVIISNKATSVKAVNGKGMLAGTTDGATPQDTIQSGGWVNVADLISSILVYNSTAFTHGAGSWLVLMGRNAT